MHNDQTFESSQEDPYFSEQPRHSMNDEENKRMYKSVQKEPLDIRSLDDPKTIQEFEKRPAYDRYNIVLDDVSEVSSQKTYGQVISINDDDDSMPVIGKNNAYINRVVD